MTKGNGMKRDDMEKEEKITQDKKEERRELTKPI